MKYRGYPKYKPSEIEWMGDIPKHWPVDRLKWSTAGLVNGTWGEEPNGVDDMICVRVADFDRNALTVVPSPETLRAIDARDRGLRLLRKGDLLIEKSGGGERQLVGCVVHFNLDITSVSSNFVARITSAQGMHPRFWCYVHAMLYSARLNYAAIKQTTGIQNLDTSSYLDTPVAFPPEIEQLAITDFLDRKTAELDALVANKRALIGKLKEKRSALISRTVTRGLPAEAARAAGFGSNPRFKQTVVDWIGSVPHHWQMNSISRLAESIQTGPFGSQLHEYDFIDRGIPLINPAHIVDGCIIPDDRSSVDQVTAQRLRRHQLRAGDIIMGRRGEIGRCAVITGTAARVALWHWLASYQTPRG